MLIALAVPKIYLEIIINNFCPMLIALAVPRIFCGSPITQCISKGYKIFFRKDLFEEVLLLLKLIHAIHYSDDFNQKRFYYPLLMGHEWPNEL